LFSELIADKPLQSEILQDQDLEGEERHIENKGFVSSADLRLGRDPFVFWILATNL
jgi:hypothetical protein